MTDIIVIVVVLSIIFAASWSMYRAKKKGIKCIGCQYSQSGGGCKR